MGRPHVEGCAVHPPARCPAPRPRPGNRARRMAGIKATAPTAASTHPKPCTMGPGRAAIHMPSAIMASAINGSRQRRKRCGGLRSQETAAHRQSPRSDCRASGPRRPPCRRAAPSAQERPGVTKGSARSRARSASEKTALGTDQDRPFGHVGGRHPKAPVFAPTSGLVCKDELPVRRPVRQHIRQAREVIDRRHIGSAALLGGLDGMGLQSITPDAFGIGELGLDRHDTRGPKLGRLFDDEIRARLLDRRAKSSHRSGGSCCGAVCASTLSTPPRFAGLRHGGAPFAFATIEERKRIAGPEAHHGEEIIRLVPRQVDGLPCAQGMLYMEPYLGTRHEAETMGDANGTPEGSGRRCRARQLGGYARTSRVAPLSATQPGGSAHRNMASAPALLVGRHAGRRRRSRRPEAVRPVDRGGLRDRRVF